MANELLSNKDTILNQWFPNGKTLGKEFCIGSVNGEAGQSLKVNLETGKWADFADNKKGGDLISLYAELKSISNKEAFLALSGNYSYKQDPARESKPKPKLTFINPLDISTSPCWDKSNKLWVYKDARCQASFLISRYEVNGKKSYSPWSFTKEKGWVKKLPPAPRPLYNLDKVLKSDNILVVEGEKAADAASKFAGNVYAVTTWANGCSAIDKTDFTPLNGKNVLLWPDADRPGKSAMSELSTKIKSSSIKILNVDGMPDKWDAADSGFNWSEFVGWAKNRAQKLPVVVRKSEYSMAPFLNSESKEIHQHLHINEDDIPGDVSSEVREVWSDLGLSRTANGEGVQNNVDNITRILTRGKKFKNKIWFDEFHGKIFSNWKSSKVYEWSDADTIKLLVKLQSSYGLNRLTANNVDQAIVFQAHQNTKNEPRDWMNSLEWDQKSRIEMFMCNYFGVEDSEYSRAVSKNWWLTMVARIMNPGCKVDNMVILEGKQGVFKSSALGVIGGKWYVGTNQKIGTKDFYLLLKGNLIVEFAELSSFSKKDLNIIKQDVTNQVDRYRDPYARHTKNNPRQCIYVGTTNDSRYLSDDTGARRFWPVLVNNIDLKAIKEDREQLFAEAVSLYKSGEKWYNVPDSSIEEQENRREVDIWEEYIDDWLSDITKAVDQTFFLTKDVWIGALGGSGDKVEGKHSRRIASILRMRGFDYKQRRHPVTSKNTKAWGKDEIL